jgi:hypothetical protein
MVNDQGDSKGIEHFAGKMEFLVEYMLDSFPCLYLKRMGNR